MKVKIGNKIYDAENEPIMVIFNESDKKNIENMNSDATKYVCFPELYPIAKIKKFMNVH